MAQSAANLVDHVLPIVPLRQFVVTFPFELRARLAYDSKLLAAVTRIAIDSVLGFYKRRMRDVDGVVGQSGAVSVVQRTSSDLRLNPHLHAILLDGVFVAGNGSPVFHPLTHLDDSDLADLLQVIRVRLVSFLLRRDVIEGRQELMLLNDDFAGCVVNRASKSTPRCQSPRWASHCMRPPRRAPTTHAALTK